MSHGSVIVYVRDISRVYLQYSINTESKKGVPFFAGSIDSKANLGFFLAERKPDIKL